MSLTALLLVCAVFVAETTWFRRSTSLTFDETLYLSCGLQTVHDGRLDARLAKKGVAPLPILLNYVVPLAFTGGEHREDPWQGELHDRQWIRWPRLANSLLCGLPLILVVYLWLLRLSGPLAATAGAALVGLSPVMVAHSAIATTDVCFTLFSLLGLAALTYYCQAPTRGRFVMAALATAAAMSTKYSGIFLLPVLAILLLMRGPVVTARDQKVSRMQWLMRQAVILAIFMALVLPCWWGFHALTFSGPLKNVALADTPDSSPWVKLLGRGEWANWFMDMAHRKLLRPAPLDGIVFQLLHDRDGHPTYLLGAVSQRGWWYYFPCAFAFKSTPTELFLAGCLVIGLCTNVRRWKSFLSTARPDHLVLGVAMLVYLVLLLRSHINLGQRYLLPLYPPLVILGLARLQKMLDARPRWWPAAVALLVACQIVSHALAAPHFLSYFNQFAGGPKNGRWLLVGSNLDWGQDLPALAEYLAHEPKERVAICYFGKDLPAAYGINADPIERLTGAPDDYELLAISVTNLQGLYHLDTDPLQKLRLLEPDAFVGHSIAIFHLDTDAEEQAMQDVVARLRAESAPQ